MRGARLALLAFLVTGLAAAPASAELAISQLIVELTKQARTADIEIFNDSPERAFVTIDPRRILNPGTGEQQPWVSGDPEKLGLIVSPRRLILEPGQHRRLRIAAVGPDSPVERIYRVTVKPVAGEVSGSDSGLKMLVGYDLLVLVRPAAGGPDVRVSRNGDSLTLTNRGTVSAELVEGQQCKSDGEACVSLPGKRLYAGASWTQAVPSSAKGRYRIHSTNGWSTLEF